MKQTPTTFSEQEVHIWHCEAEKISETLLLSRYRSWLSAEEDRKRLRYRFEKHQHQYLVTRALIRSILSHYLPGIPPEEWRFELNDWGKPSIIAEQNPDNLVFNLSHTDGLIVCAVTQHHQLGVDVENITRDGETIKIADRYFSPSEFRALIALPENQQNDRFFDLWTLKESYIKACGKGLAIPLDQFSFEFPADNSVLTDISLYTEPERNDDPQLWKFWNWYLSDQHRLSLGLKSKTKLARSSINISHIKSVPLMSTSLIDP